MSGLCSKHEVVNSLWHKYNSSQQNNCPPNPGFQGDGPLQSGRTVHRRYGRSSESVAAVQNSVGSVQSILGSIYTSIVQSSMSRSKSTLFSFGSADMRSFQQSLNTCNNTERRKGPAESDLRNWSTPACQVEARAVEAMITFCVFVAAIITATSSVVLVLCLKQTSSVAVLEIGCFLENDSK